MKLREYIAVIYDKIVIYKQIDDGEFNGEFEDIYKGNRSNIPEDILDMEVKSIGGKGRGILDIRVITK